MSKKLKPIPSFKNEDEEREFWSTHDSTDYIDWDQAVFVRFPNLKPSTETISLRMPQSLLDDIKIMANVRDVPYQSLIKMLLHDAVHGTSYTHNSSQGLVLGEKPATYQTKSKPKKSS